METYNTYLISTDTFKATQLIGENLGLTRSKIRSRSYEVVINPLVQFVVMCEVGGDRDLECKKDLEDAK